MKTPLNLCWHYEVQHKKMYTGRLPRNVEDLPIYCYTLINGDDKFYHEDMAILGSKLSKFIKKLPFASDFEKPINEERDEEAIRIMQIHPGKYIYIKFKYYTLSFENYLDITITPKDEDMFSLIITKNKFHRNTRYHHMERKKTKHIPKAEAMEIIGELPETIELGIFKLPFGNCFERDCIEC